MRSSRGYEQLAKIHNLKQAAKELKAAQIGDKLPSVPTLQAEYEKLQGQKESLYADYGQAEKTGVGI